ncbi:Gaa1-domain-containing protein [Lentinus tigrinus ALCF2SS1-7]|uniref:Gaa1-domain-containing protein n=1 Tax=Lentinus tigrinus ALCF2SS1-6 TaxID=1328759 RepID=A0A5C2SQI6_9APHY|nr:Gaa1-domain-containing protein [Lentinus tigrinus ALCF2SS1-6]RPD80045.1 Gaa1-domain-containing protein [Lentinus tigrinus ALCF2SS1-7]
MLRAIPAIRRRLRGGGDPNAARIRRRQALANKAWQGLPYIRIVLFTVGYLWLLAIPSSQFGQRTYIDENALQPGQVHTYWSWNDVHRADRVLEDLERLRDQNATSNEIANYAVGEFEKIGIPARIQHYSFDTVDGVLEGTNAYAVMQSPRASGAEAIVISASWLSRTGEGDGTLNLRGVATVISLAQYLKKYSLWAKDLVFVISDGYLDGMQAWITTYHGAAQPNLHAEPLTLSSGVIWTAINVDYPGHSFSHLGIFFEGLNGRLPNQDLLNSVSLIARHTGGVPVLVHDHVDPRDTPNTPSILPAWLPEALKSNADVQEYAVRARNIVRHMNYQARGAASGVHGLLHRFRIDAITVFAVPATGPHGFHSLGKILESSLRTMNNLLERLHASFFFFLLVGPGTFMKIGSYLPSVILVGTAMLFSGLGEWVNAGWTLASPPPLGGDEKTEKASAHTSWVQRPRPVLQAVSIMAATHLLGVLLFYALNSGLVPSTVIFLLFAILPVLALQLVSSPAPPSAPLATVLKAFNLCFASAVISITSVLNFSLAAALAVFMGLPLTVASSSPSQPKRVVKYALYSVLALGWLVLCPEETRKAIWNWEVLEVWFAPFICIVYTPLVLQAALACSLP